MPQDDHLAPLYPVWVQAGKGDGNGDSGGQTGATAGGHMTQAIVSGVSGCE